MEFVLSFNQPEAEIERHESSEHGAAAMEPWKAYMSELAEAGVMRGGSRLAPPWTATTVRIRNGTRTFHDGPFAETREMVAGFVVIEVESLDAALKWAERSPSSQSGSTEVRPIAPMP